MSIDIINPNVGGDDVPKDRLHDYYKERLEKLLASFGEKDYRRLTLKYMRYTPQQLTEALQKNNALMSGLEDIVLKVKLTGELRKGLGSVLQMGLQLGFYLAIEELTNAANKTQN